MSIRQAITVVPAVFLFLLLSSATFNIPSKALGEETIRVAVPLFPALGFPMKSEEVLSLRGVRL